MVDLISREELSRVLHDHWLGAAARGIVIDDTAYMGVGIAAELRAYKALADDFGIPLDFTDQDVTAAISAYRAQANGEVSQ